MKKTEEKQKEAEFSVTTLLKDVKNVMTVDEQQKLQLDINPDLNKTLEKQQLKAKRGMQLSSASVAFVMLGRFYPMLKIPAAMAVLYLFRHVLA